MLKPLTLSHITYTYPNLGEPTLEDVSITFSPGWTAIIGDNGIGKSTLARCALGMLPLNSGNIMPNPHNLVTANCPQSIAEPPENLDEFAGDWSQLAIALRTDLQIEEDWLYRYAELSGGQARRVHIACTLVKQADVVVLDEPTNHCDARTRHIIAQTLNHVSCVGLLISHDVAFIDEVAQQCAVFERVHSNGSNRVSVQLYSGNYTQVQEQLDSKHQSQQRQLAQHTQKLNSIKQARQQSFAKVQHAQAQKSASVDMHDHDARAMRKLAKSTSLDSGVSQAYARFNSKLQSLEDQASSLETAAKRYSGQLRYETQASSRTELLALPQGLISVSTDEVEPLDNLQRDAMLEQTLAAGAPYQLSQLQKNDSTWHVSLFTHARSQQANQKSTDPESEQGTTTAAEARITDDFPDDVNQDVAVTQMMIPSLSIGATDHIALTGSNGLGKSTLLRTISRALAQSEHPVPALVIKQTIAPEEIHQALTELQQLPKERQSLVLSNIAQLNADPDHVIAGNEISPGEARKILLCLGLAKAPQLLILDEPTNHLDISSTVLLAKVLHDFPGAVLVASHNEYFIHRFLGQERM